MGSRCLCEVCTPAALRHSKDQVASAERPKLTVRPLRTVHPVRRETNGAQRGGHPCGSMAALADAGEVAAASALEQRLDRPVGHAEVEVLRSMAQRVDAVRERPTQGAHSGFNARRERVRLASTTAESRAMREALPTAEGRSCEHPEEDGLAQLSCQHGARRRWFYFIARTSKDNGQRARSNHVDIENSTNTALGTVCAWQDPCSSVPWLGLMAGPSHLQRPSTSTRGREEASGLGAIHS